MTYAWALVFGAFWPSGPPDGFHIWDRSREQFHIWDLLGPPPPYWDIGEFTRSLVHRFSIPYVYTAKWRVAKMCRLEK